MTVKQIQCLLTYLGYNPGAVDGVNGLKTAAAVLVFQQQEGLRRDGVPYSEAVDPLDSGRTYTETDALIEAEHMTETEEKAMAYDILTGVTE